MKVGIQSSLTVNGRLLLLVSTGLLLTTLIWYPAPGVVLPGIVAVIVPDAVPLSVPIFTGLAKLPEALLSCAVNTFPPLTGPETVKLTASVESGQALAEDRDTTEISVSSTVQSLMVNGRFRTRKDRVAGCYPKLVSRSGSSTTGNSCRYTAGTRSCKRADINRTIKTAGGIT
jgi:hypothetical protein